ncbi:hypothetical protein C9374_005532 [Naegleria lovaniensis]|uniref:Uncharacterized protein n=1 Tax=Naegleria lovaniensis TaxID=51637 RepID=A0AA88GLB7_NAELO|nr:uncharacterized protein C9374_005532 [Naegleria lovaniensis]KAG2382330.1 hypothetical protein C9374_005532 [Naegleria lovaniensis]
MNKIPSQKSSHNNVMPTHRKQQSTTSRKSKQSTPKKNDTLGSLNDLDAQKKDASDDHINMMGSILRKSKQKLKKHIQKKNSKHQKPHAIAPTKSIGKSQQQMDSKPNTKKRKTQNDRNQESKKRKNQKEPETQDMLYEDDLMQEDEDDESPYHPLITIQMNLTLLTI